MSSDNEPKTEGYGRPRVSLPVLFVGLALAYLPTYLPSLARTVGIEIPLPGPARNIVWQWLAVGLLLAYVFRVEKLDWSSLRLVKPTEKDLEWAGWLGGALMAWAWAASFLVPPALQQHAEGAQSTLVALGPLLALGLVLTAGITEEILWRGYATERLAAWIGPWLASALSLMIFAIGHIPFFGPGWLITTLPTAVMFYVVLAWRRNLWVAIIMHLLGNSPIFLMSILALF